MQYAYLEDKHPTQKIHGRSVECDKNGRNDH